MHPLLEQGQRRFRISGGDDGKPHLVQQLFKKIEYARIIVHNEDFPGCAAGRRGAGLARGETVFNRLRDGIDGRYRFGEGGAGCFASIIPFGRGKSCGKNTEKRAPPQGRLATRTAPRLRWTRLWTCASPRPLPPFSCFVVKKGSKMNSMSRRDAFPGIGNVYADIAALGKLVSGTVPLHGVEPGGNCELASIRHCLDGVEAQVEEDLMHLNGYGPDTRFGTGVAHVEGNVGRSCG